MLAKSNIGFLAVSVLSFTQTAFGRYRWLERDGRAVHLYPRRFGMETPAVIDKLRVACPGDVCATLAGAAITPLLAAQPECSQQDMADKIIDAAQQFDDATRTLMISLAIEYRQAEKNTPPDFSAQPNILRNSVFCTKAPKNAELNGLVQAQDPSNDPDVFFDPALGKSVTKGSQPNTFPFGTSGSDSTSAANSQVVVARAASDIGDFGTCSVPQIEFGVGFDNRKETSFEPVDKTSYNHGSAQNIDIITQFMCDQLVNSCGADATAQATCAKAKAAADTGTPKTGVQADLFNAVFGITTDFAAVQAVDDQGRPIAGTGSAAASASSDAGAATSTAGASSFASTAAASSSGIGNFGSCSVPQIEFGVGFDNRKETSFQPVDKTSYNHGSAQNIDIITQFMCDQLVNSCGADATAQATCAKAKAAADTGTPKTGVQADLFNAVFGITTDFAAVQAVDDQGRPIAGTGSAAVAASASSDAGAAASSAAAAPSSASTAAASSSGIGNFGSCSVPQIEFGVGFDNRKETSFQPVDKVSYNHGSAQNIDIITQFMCDQLVNSCGADATAQATCAKAKAAADTGAPKTGVQADLFNAVFGITTDFASVEAVDDQGNPIPGTAISSSDAASSAVASATVLAADTPCESTITVTVSATATFSAASNAVTVSVGASSAAAAAASSTASSSGIGNFGSCSIPQIEFGAGFDGRKETSFEPVDKTSYNHGSAQNIDIITQFICDTLVNSCGADATAQATCAKAKAAADTGTAKTGIQADLFNAEFGITTDFAAVQALDDQGNPIAGTTSSGSASSSSSSAATTGDATTTAGASSTETAAATTSSATSSANGGIGNFGSCSVPEIQFGVGFDGRKETSFEPANLTSFNHGSADNIAVITDFICGALASNCKADATAQATCTKAQAAANAATPGTGAQADAFNAVFGIQTDFDAVAVVDNTGKVVSEETTNPGPNDAAGAAPATTTANTASSTTATAPPAGGNLQAFTGNLGGVTAPPVTAVGNGQFQVEGNSAFNNLQNALVRSCDVQHNQCADAANASGNKGDLTVAACGDQQTQCDAAAQA